MVNLRCVSIRCYRLRYCKHENESICVLGLYYFDAVVCVVVVDYILFIDIKLGFLVLLLSLLRFVFNLFTDVVVYADMNFDLQPAKLVLSL